jgi:hypothetical protein
VYGRIKQSCADVGLKIVGGFHPMEADKAPAGCRTLLLLGPREPGFWGRITSSAEFDAPDPVDRWSQRVVFALAEELGATPLFPFGGPPYLPFVSWALRSGRVWLSPVSLMVHDKAGLMLSFRGALAFEEVIELPPDPVASPCESCVAKPCLSACPASALTAEGYDLPACHKWLDEPQGAPCMSGGCLVRRSCPVSQGYGRLKEQSAHHMRAFHKG